ncbi:MAG: polysaccharide biosynthesis/export family protein [Limisphaerales bacterium]
MNITIGFRLIGSAGLCAVAASLLTSCHSATPWRKYDQAALPPPTPGNGLRAANLPAETPSPSGSSPAPATNSIRAAKPPLTPALDPRTASYAANALQEGDVVSIMFQYSTNFNSLQKVMLDGMLNCEAIGQVKAAGKTPFELQDEIIRLYERLPQVKDDIITVRLVAAAACVYVSGAVLRPGKIPLEHPMTAFEAIMEAGGFDASRASLSRATVVRVEGGKQRIYRLDLRRVLRGKEDKPFYLKPFDTLHVPIKTFNF